MVCQWTKMYHSSQPVLFFSWRSLKWVTHIKTSSFFTICVWSLSLPLSFCLSLPLFFSLFIFHSRWSQKPDSHGPQWFVRSLRKTQAHPRPKERDQTEDQDHPLLAQPHLERVFHLVSATGHSLGVVTCYNPIINNTSKMIWFFWGGKKKYTQ